MDVVKSALLRLFQYVGVCHLLLISDGVFVGLGEVPAQS